MKTNFWKELKKPIMALAPLANVTDAAFRRVIAKYGKPDVMFTEFVSVDGLFLCPVRESLPVGKRRNFEEIAFSNGVAHDNPLLYDLQFTEAERPIVAQFFTARPEMMERAARFADELGFDGVDINMGCPDRSIEKQGAGAALIKTPKLARELVVAARKGAPRLPISLKTRIGYNKNEIETWLPELLAEEPVAITLHARTRKEMSKVPAHWDVVKRAVEIRDELKSETFILGNGDVLDLYDARKKAEETGADGIMLGKAIFGNPWLFSQRENNPERSRRIISIEERIQIMLEHTKLFEELLGDVKNFAVMKKHYKAYANGFNGAKELRAKLMETKNAQEVEHLVSDFLHSCQ
ncbi:MAG: tRNA-dihydrouridine synthase [bacterium]|nr:tRNA-dihydrouridine synthase [bacterium]